MELYGENNEERIKKEALIDNTAQAIFNYLKEIENKREIFEERWIWELLQNALDAAPPDGKIKVEIINEDNKLTFKHNGRPFKLEEVAHLIYHGSTKKGEDIGKFGTGFLVTHLLSKEVTVRGVREDGKKFTFLLNRNGTSADDIKRCMEETWREYQGSLSLEEGSLSYTAEYTYPLSDPCLRTVEAGIEALTKIAPYIIAFNDKLGEIVITNQNNKLKFELFNESNETDYVKKIVKEERDGRESLHELWIVKGEDVEIAVEVKKQENGTYQIVDLQKIPKIFLAFPLFGTQDLPFPVIVNSKKFEPTEKRDGIYLGREETDSIRRNKELLEKARELFIKLISNSDTNRLENAYILLRLSAPPAKEWLDQEWYTQLLRELIYEIKRRNIRVVKTESGCIPYTEAYFPDIGSVEKEKLVKLWELCYQFSAYRDKIVAKDIASEWAKIIEEWKSLGLDLFGLDLSKRQITIEKIAEEIEKSGSLQNFKTKLAPDVDELNILNNFYELLLDAEKRELLDEKSILVDQNGDFKKKPNLYRDEGIDEVLKHISSKLGMDVRSQLLHLRISPDVQNLLPPKKQEEVLSQVINKVKQQPSEDPLYIKANIELFNWLLEHDKFEHFEGYPILSCKEKIFTSLSKKERILAPKDIWDEKARIYAEIFPQDSVFSSDYFEKISQKDKWEKLKDFVLTNPLYNETEKIDGDKLVLLSGEILEEDKEHGTKDPIELSKIAFLEVKDKGIIDTVRKSKEKARKFLGFLFDYVIEKDNSWSELKEVSCRCGSQHKIYASSWLGTLKDRAWVPLRKDKSENPNAQILATLVKDDQELLKKCNQEKSIILLNRLNISISELMMNVVVAENEEIRVELDKAMGSLFNTFIKNPSQLSKIASLAKSEPDLFIKEIDKLMQNAEEIRRNQQVGELVENIIKGVLEEEEGFKVERTGIGSDFVIKIGKEAKECFLEIKSTSQDFVRMTFTQAKEARDKSDRYVLCVVRLNGLEINEDTIKSGAKFVTDIGQKIQDKVNFIEELLKDKQEKISVPEDIQIEIEDYIYFKINKSIWEEGKTLNQFFIFLHEL